MSLLDYVRDPETEKKEEMWKPNQVLERSTKNQRKQVKIPEKKRVRFVHLADVHLGAFKAQHEALRDASIKLLKMVVEFCKKYDVDFILIAGDLFHGNVVKIEIQKECAAILTEASEHGIRVYAVYGTHDASPTHNSSVDVLVAAKRLTLVERMKYGENEKIQLQPVIDKSNFAIVGVHGRKREGEAAYLEAMDFEMLEKIPGPKIFMLHSAVAEYKPDFLKGEEGIPLSLLPRNFDYYACGHVHRRSINFANGYGLIVYPGALFGSSMKDLEENTERLPGFYLIDFDEQILEQNLTFIDIYSLEELTGHVGVIPDIMFTQFSFENTTPREVEKQLKNWIENKDLSNTVVYIKLEGKLSEGRRSEIPFEAIARTGIERGAIDVLVNRENLFEQDIQTGHVVHGDSIEEIERKVVEVFFMEREEREQALRFLSILGTEKLAGESEKSYLERIKGEVWKELGL